MTNTQKNEVVVRFCRGESVRGIADWACVREQTVERLIRDAMSQLIRKASDPEPVVVHG
jgi:hypothetical protein